MSNAILNHDQVEAMIDMGFPAAMIAERLGCSVRQVYRIAQDRGLEMWHCDHLGTEYERPFVWDLWRELGKSPAWIAFHVGRSRQLVTEYFSQPRIYNDELID